MAFVLVGISPPGRVIGLDLAVRLRLQARVVTPNAGLLRLHQPDERRPAAGRCSGPTTSSCRGSRSRCSSPAIYVRMIRANVMDTLNEDYVRTARAKGAPEPQVMRSHVLRNALLPVVTMLGMDIGIALGGAIFTETIFGLPGPRPARRAGARELRPADDPGRGRLPDALHHRLQRAWSTLPTPSSTPGIRLN